MTAPGLAILRPIDARTPAREILYSSLTGRLAGITAQGIVMYSIIRSKLSASSITFLFIFPFSFNANALSLEQTNNSIGSIVVTGSKYPEDSLQVPSFITTISRQQIQESGAMTVDEAISRIGGIPSRPSLYGGNELKLDLGGFGDASQNNQLIVIDGVPYQQGDSSENRLSYIPLDQVERIEIQRGASSVLYGNGAVGGVINIITKSTGADSEKPFANLYTSYGSFNTSDTRSTVVYGNKNFSLIFSGTNRRSDGYRSNSASKERDGKLTFKYKHSLFLSSIYVETNDLEARTPGALTLSEFQSNPRASYSGYKNDVWNNAINQVGGYLETDINSVVVRLNARHQDRLVRYVATQSGRTIYENTQFSRAKSTADTFDLNFKKDINSTLGNNTLIGGISQNYWNMTSISTSTNYPSNRGSSSSNGIYAQNDFKLTGFQTLIRLGYRTENFTQDSLYLATKEKYNLHASELALSQPVNKFNSLYIRRAKSFSIPNTDYIGNMWPVVALRPQIGFEREIGWKFNHFSGTNLNFRYYINDITDEIAYDPLTGNQLNLPQTQRRGINLSGEFIPLRNLTIGSTIDLRNATITAGTYNGKTAPLNPNTFSLRAKYDLTDNQSLGTQWNYVSRQVTSADYNNLNRIPSYDTLDIRYAYKYSKSADFSVGIKNVMDKNYYSYSVIDYTSTAYYYPDPRRTFMASARFMFD
jgi:iron complex outermembrane receptor protein